MKIKPSKIFASSCTESQDLQSENQDLRYTSDQVYTFEPRGFNGAFVLQI